MKPRVHHEHRWGVILAGGDGLRLRPLTRLVSGDDRPKQFCPLIEGATLLNRTRLRIEGSIPPCRTLCVLTRSHEPFYRADVEDLTPAQTIVQPSSRGTSPAILGSLMRIARLDPSAVVAFFPSDHYYSDEGNFMVGVETACAAAEGGFPHVILLGAPAKDADARLGWIEAEDASSGADVHSLMQVRHFWEPGSRRCEPDRGL